MRFCVAFTEIYTLYRAYSKRFGLRNFSSYSRGCHSGASSLEDMYAGSLAGGLMHENSTHVVSIRRWG